MIKVLNQIIFVATSWLFILLYLDAPSQKHQTNVCITNRLHILFINF